MPRITVGLAIEKIEHKTPFEKVVSNEYAI